MDQERATRRWRSNHLVPAELTARWSERIRNLEDMLFAAYCNGVVESAEKKAVVEYARRLGINQKQLDVIKQEAVRRYEEFKSR